VTAVAESERAVARRPTCLRVQVGLGHHLTMIGQYDRAAQIYGDVIRQDPSDSAGHAGLASLLARQGQVDLALDSLARAIGHDPLRIAADPGFASLWPLAVYARLLSAM
jgi:Flp pilus assembly protein TadD